MRYGYGQTCFTCLTPLESKADSGGMAADEKRVPSTDHYEISRG